MTKSKPFHFKDLETYKIIFFDFDGVILESTNIKSEAFVEMFREYGIEKEVYEYHMKYQGVSRFEKFKWIYATLLNKEIDEQELKRLGDKFTEIVFDKIIKAPFVPGIEAFLTEVKKHNIIAIVASGTPEEELKQIVKLRNLDKYFNGVFGSPKKKDTIVNEHLAMYNFDKSSALFVGDAITDYEAAQKTNIHFLGRNTEEMKTFWETVSIDYLVNDFSKC